MLHMRFRKDDLNAKSQVWLHFRHDMPCYFSKVRNSMIQRSLEMVVIFDWHKFLHKKVFGAVVFGIFLYITLKSVGCAVLI